MPPMTVPAPSPGPVMSLAELVERYLAQAGGFGKPAAIASLGFSKAGAEKALSLFEEDYNISRFLRFRRERGESFQINGFPQTHLLIDAEIRSIL